ncbi:Hypothetical Protein FCC1311_108082 [Hondaea fermentalgiana]|uniref:Small ribosomal subunit protein mS23 n=1 Tax=Hondaea fermentalgiana TaxID=2315210 RepID=A0A2R5GUN9_9STRA|nr:Hypothetical Protein FCC1311_108082 [Hondaea fermentalgiana]|eukprot:GBG34587.1 Hypothetical Protein FCC1311_108082 [Hondaea fermentalgiana]
MSAWKAFRKTMNIVERTERLMGKGAIQRKPKWFDIMKAIPPSEPWEFKEYRKAIKFPEEGLLQRFYRRNPELLSSEVYDPEVRSSMPVAFRFVGLQLKYMKEKGLPEYEAYERVKRELGHDMKSNVAASAESFEEDVNVEAEGGAIKSSRGDADSISLRDKFREWTEAEQQYYQAKASKKKK